MRRVIQYSIFSLLAIMIAACSSGPLRSFSAGDELATFSFAEAQTFEEGAYEDATLRVINGVYRIVVNQGDGEIWWGQWGDKLGDVVIDVEIEQVSERNENAYGVACRLRGEVGQPVEIDPELAAVASGETGEDTAEATEEATSEADAESTEVVSESGEDADTEAELENLPNGDGYMFLIRGDGNYAIMRARGRNLTPLVNWTQSDLINQGPGRNELRAVCMGDYFALYINGEFAGDATDSTYESGQVGLAASAYNRLGVQIEFDNLVVHEATTS